MWAFLIITLISPFLNNWGISDKIDLIMPIPPSKKERVFQPVIEISTRISRYLNKPILLDIIQKSSTIQSKDLDSAEKSQIAGSITMRRTLKRQANILLIDDLYQTGETLSETVSVLKSDPSVKDIYVLTMTKTRR